MTLDKNAISDLTEVERASINNKRVNELSVEIERCREFQISCKKANDNIGDKIWSDHIKTLKAEKHTLDQSTRYMRLTLFTKAVKTKLSPDEYEDCWRIVESVLYNPQLLQ